MRVLVALLVAFAGIVGYGAHRYRQAKMVQISRANTLLDSLRREDSLAIHGRTGSDSIMAARKAAIGQMPQVTRPQVERPAPVKLKRPETRYIRRDPAPTNRRP